MMYRELLAKLNSLTEAQLDMTVTIYDQSIDEYVGLKSFSIDSTDVLDEGHPVLVLSWEE